MASLMDRPFDLLSEESRDAMRQYLTSHAADQSTQYSGMTIVEVLSCILISDSSETWTKVNILDCMLATFRKVRLNAAKSFVDPMHRINPVKQIHKALQHNANIFYRKRVRHETVTTEAFSVKPADARLELRRILYPDLSTSFPFLRLPGELRIRMYRELLTWPEHYLELNSKRYFSLTSRRGGKLSILGHLPTHRALALFVAGKQTYNEALPISHGENSFIVRGDWMLDKFARYPKTEGIGFLVDVTLDLGTDDWHQVLVYCERLPFMRRLRRLQFRSWGDLEDTIKQDPVWRGIYSHDQNDPTKQTTLAAAFCKLRTSVPFLPPWAQRLSYLNGKLRGVEKLDFRPRCPHVDAFLRPWITLPRGTENVNWASMERSDP